LGGDCNKLGVLRAAGCLFILTPLLLSLARNRERSMQPLCTLLSVVIPLAVSALCALALFSLAFVLLSQLLDDRTRSCFGMVVRLSASVLCPFAAVLGVVWLLFGVGNAYVRLVFFKPPAKSDSQLLDGGQGLAFFPCRASPLAY
jgi:hypothetical protein